MQTQSVPRRKPKVTPRILAPSGREYLLNPDGTIVDPETGLIYNPLAGIVADPQTGAMIDLKSGLILDANGNVIGKVSASDLYGFRPVTPTTPRVQKVSPPARPPKRRLQQVGEGVKKVGSKLASVLERYWENTYESATIRPNPKGAEELVKRLMYAKDKLREKTALIQQVLDDLIDYVRYTGVDAINPKLFVETVYPNADEEMKREILYIIDFLWKSGIVPPKD